MMDLLFSLCLVLTCLVLAIGMFSLPFFSFIDEETDAARANSLDGMRFILASFVIFHHIDCAYTYITKGKWMPTSDWLLYLGKYGVALFFMITAFLFWGKVRTSNQIDWVELYKKRFYRIAPLSFFCSAIALASLFLLTQRKDFSQSILAASLSWFDAGLWNSKPAVTEFTPPFMALAGVTWTLRWEWIFYFTLPLFFMLKKWSFELSVSVFAFSVYFLPEFTKDAYLWSYFFAGMLCSVLKDKINLTSKHANIILVLMILITLLVQPTLYAPPEKIFLSVIFFSVISGANLYGILISKAAIRLGAISYSLYLTQGLILFPMVIHFKNQGDLELNINTFIIFAASYILICILSSLTFHFIERPFMKRFKPKSISEQAYNK
ncbi:acyltransferase family protein [Enterobacter cloacae]|uniref:acyltransferase family protein n=1 Tax=Enterobacter cloacae TaxID=550 RepID=UPI001FD2555B|nr:acyltransferase [Enterobacter cloacae]